MKNLILLIITVLSVSYTQAQPYNFEWGVNFFGYNGSDPTSHLKIMDMAVDDQGNVYSVGYFQDTVDFDPGIGEFIGVSAGEIDCFVQKLDASGNFLWVKTFGGTYHDKVESIDIDVNGDIIISGSFGDFFTVGATTIYSPYTGPLSSFVIKMHSSGNFIWVKDFKIKKDVTYSAKNSFVKSKSDGSIFFAGNFLDTTELQVVPDLTGPGLFVLELSSSGSINWAKSIKTNGVDIDVDDQDNLYITGIFGDTVDFDPNNGVNEVVPTTNSDAFITKWNSSGNFIWVKTYESITLESIVVDHSNNLVIGAKNFGTVQFDSLGTLTDPIVSNGGADCLLFKIDSSGHYMWAKSFGGQHHDNLKSVAVDAFNNIFIMGTYKGAVDFDPTPNIDYFFSLNNTSDFFVGQFSPNGTMQAVRTIESDGVDGNSENPIIRVDGNNNFYLSGLIDYYDINTIDVDLEAGVFNIPASANFYNNNFIVKHSNSFASIEENQFSDVSIFPNPTNGVVNIQFGEAQSAQIRVVNINGQLIYQEEMNNQDTHSFELDAESGIYFVEITNENSRKVIKIVKE